MFDPNVVKRVLREVAVQYPRAFKNCHKDENQHPEAWDFIILGGRELFRIDPLYGLNGKRGDSNNLSSDIIAYGHGRGCRVFDILIGAGEHGEDLNRIACQEVTEDSKDEHGNILTVYVNPNERTPFIWTSNDDILIGCSIFPVMGMLFQGEVDRLRRNLDFFKSKFNGDYIRWFYTVGGHHFEGFDPWSEIGSFIDDPRHNEVFLLSLDLLKSMGLKSHLVLVGSHEQADNIEKELIIVESCTHLIRGREDEFVLTEMRNEYLVNGGQSHNCRNMARAFRSRVRPGFPITLSSLDCVMRGNETTTVVREEYDHLYGGDSGANCVTIHNTRPEPIWNPKSLRERLGLTVDIWDSEGRGPGASSGGDVSNPEIFRTDLNNAKAGRAKGILFHSRPGVWLGRCNPYFVRENSPANLYDIPGIELIASVYSGGSVIPIEEHVAKHPYPSPEAAYWEPFEQEAARLYKKAGVDIPAKVFEAGRHMARTAYDLADSLTPEASKEKHLNKLAEALGVNRD